MNLQLNTWYRIPFYNGYELQLTERKTHQHSYPVCVHDTLHCYFWIRSFKNYKKYPHGYILPYIHFGKYRKVSYYYELTDAANKRVRLKIKDIVKLIEDSGLELSVYDCYTNIGSRNKVLFDVEKAPYSASSINLILDDKPKHRDLVTFH